MATEEHSPPADELRALRRPVAITGIGVLNGDRVGVEPFWDRLIAPDPGPTSTRLVDFNARDWLDRRLARHTDPFAQYAAAAATLAATDAGDLGCSPERTGVVMGTGIGSGASLMREYQRFAAEGAAAVSPLLGVRTMTNAPASIVALTQQAKGPTFAVASGCASGTHAVGEGARLIQYGSCDVVYAGGSESFHGLDPEEDYAEAILAALANLRVTTDDAIARPFDRDRSGFIAADGACVLVLEDAERAHRRGAHVYGLVAGYGNTNDAFDLIAPEPGGEGIRRCMRVALADAGRPVTDVGFVNTHGTGTLSNDLAEARAIAELFGAPGPAVNSIKGVVGHVGPAAGAVEIAATVLAVHHRLIPATGGLVDPDPTLEIDLVVDAPRPWRPGLALALSLGLGGHNGCVALAPDESPDDHVRPRA